MTDADKAELKRLGSWQSPEARDWRISGEAIALMNDTLINEINSHVGVDDTLWHLGDFAMAGKYDYYAKCKTYRDRIRCQNVNLIWGNHDDRRIRDLFNETYDLKAIYVGNIQIALCHYAMAIWDKSHRQAIHLYGHSHAEAEDWLNKIMPSRRSMDVGVDNAFKLYGSYRPISIQEIESYFSNRVGFSFDHHTNELSQRPPT